MGSEMCIRDRPLLLPPRSPLLLQHPPLLSLSLLTSASLTLLTSASLSLLTSASLSLLASASLSLLTSASLSLSSPLLLSPSSPPLLSPSSSLPASISSPSRFTHAPVGALFRSNATPYAHSSCSNHTLTFSAHPPTPCPRHPRTRPSARPPPPRPKAAPPPTPRRPLPPSTHSARRAAVHTGLYLLRACWSARPPLLERRRCHARAPLLRLSARAQWPRPRKASSQQHLPSQTHKKPRCAVWGKKVLSVHSRMPMRQSLR